MINGSIEYEGVTAVIHNTITIHTLETQIYSIEGDEVESGPWVDRATLVLIETMARIGAIPGYGHILGDKIQIWITNVRGGFKPMLEINKKGEVRVNTMRQGVHMIQGNRINGIRIWRLRRDEFIKVAEKDLRRIWESMYQTAERKAEKLLMTEREKDREIMEIGNLIYSNAISKEKQKAEMIKGRIRQEITEGVMI